MTRQPIPAFLLALVAAPVLGQPSSDMTPPATPAAAGESQPPAEITNPRRDPAFSLSLSGSYGGNADLDSGDGEFQVARLRAGFDVTLDLGGKRALTLGAAAERSWYDFENAIALDPSGEPFTDITDTEVFARFAAPLNDTTNWFALASIGLAAEDGADLSDAMVYTGAAGFVTKASDTFSWGLGILVRSQLEDDVLVIPLPQIRWAISDKWTLESQRAGLRLGYAHSETLTYGLQGEYVSRSFRLDEDGPIPDGMGTDRRVPIAFFADYKPAPNVTLTGQIGAAVLGNIELLDEAGNDLTDEDVDPSLFLGLGAKITF